MGSTPNQYQQSGPIGNYPSQWWGNEFQGGNYFQPQQQLWQNPFSPMSAADWAALKDKYNPTQAPAPPPQPGTIEHAESIAGVPRSRIDYPGYMQAMATLYGTKTNLGVPQGYQGGQGGDGYYYQTPTGERMYSPIAYEYQGKYYEPHQGALDWVNRYLSEKSGVKESRYGTKTTDLSMAITGRISDYLAEKFGWTGIDWGVPDTRVGDYGYRSDLGAYGGQDLGFGGGIGEDPGGWGGFGDNEGYGGGEGGARGW